MSSISYEVRELDLHRRSDRQRFVDLPFELARSHPAWHPGLRIFANELVHPLRNPFWHGRTASFFVIEWHRRVVGRAGVIAPGNVPQRPYAAILVLPDFIDDDGVVHALFEAVSRRAREYGAQELVGPMNPDIHHDVGIQIDGFEHRNAVFMGYQPPYYARQMEAQAFQGLTEFQAWRLDRDRYAEDPRLPSLVRRVERGGLLCIRSAEVEHFDEELLRFHDLYTRSFADHWGFQPPTWDEFRFVAADIRYLLRPGMALIAEWDGQPVGFALSVPDLFAILPRNTQGRLTPVLAARTFWRWRSMAEARVMIAGVLPGFRRFGVHLPLFYRLRDNLFELGFRSGEISWVMQDNRALQRVLPMLGAIPVRTYRLYVRSLVRGRSASSEDVRT